MAKPPRYKYKRKGGLVCLPRQMVFSHAFRDLKPQSQALLLALQGVWRPPSNLVHFSVRQGAKAINVCHRTSASSFLDLLDHGFIRVENQSDFVSGMAREFALTWNPNGDREPTDEWLLWGHEN